jgi:23S rRNA (cytosine1962-C5)-methyltransferase
VAGAGLDAGIDGYLIARLEAAPDHPTTITYPEGEYLKGLAIVKNAHIMKIRATGQSDISL